jgi:ribose transport system ATP-binding protein
VTFDADDPMTRQDHPAPDHEGGPPALVVRGAAMRFGPRLVLDDVDLTVRAGEVHALVGANGSGKSTFVKIICGNHVPTAVAEFSLSGTPVPLPATVAGMQARGVRVVYQELGLVEELSILENIALSRHYYRRAGRIDWRATRRAVAEALEVVGLPHHPDTPVARLAAWERVAVVLARALYGRLDQVRLLVLDEITAALPSEEVGLVIEITGRLKELGAGVLYISHRFEEVFAIADQVTVLRDGRVVRQGPKEGLSPDQLVALVAGERVEQARASRVLDASRPGLELKEATNDRLHNVSLSVAAQEIVGVIGRAGCGRSALGRAVFGLEPLSAGELLVAGRPVPAGRPWRALRARVAYVGQDRGRAGSIHGASVQDNLTIASMRDVSVRGWISGRRERALARSLIDRCQIVPPDPSALIETLSGGNQQKIVVGRWLPRQPALLVLDEPTEGVDVGARQAIYATVRDLAASGTAVLVLSSSAEEVVQLCDRVLFFAGGRVAATLSGDQLSIEAIENLLLYREEFQDDPSGEAA